MGLATRTSVDYTNIFVKFKQEMTKTPAQPKVVFQPLTSWPAKAHPRQAEIDAHCHTPSRYT